MKGRDSSPIVSDVDRGSGWGFVSVVEYVEREYQTCSTAIFTEDRSGRKVVDPNKTEAVRRWSGSSTFQQLEVRGKGADRRSTVKIGNYYRPTQAICGIGQMKGSIGSNGGTSIDFGSCRHCAIIKIEGDLRIRDRDRGDNRYYCLTAGNRA